MLTIYKNVYEALFLHICNLQRDNIFKLYKFIKILQPNTVVRFVLFLSFIKSIKILIFFKKKAIFT